MNGLLPLEPNCNGRIINTQFAKYIKIKRAAHQDGYKLKCYDILDFALQNPDYGSSATLSGLVDQVKTFFFAGHDTTAATICWAYYFLHHNPTELLRLRKESDDLFGVDASPNWLRKC